MSTDQENFVKWFVTPMERLKPDGHAGFIFAIVSLPLLERFLREKSGIGENRSLTSPFYVQLESYFPDLIGRGQEFWEVYRHALLHQATFKTEKRDTSGVILQVFPEAGLSGYDPRPIYFSPMHNAYYMNPLAFHKRVIDIIQNEFSAYLAPSSPGHPPSTIYHPPPMQHPHQAGNSAPNVVDRPPASGSYKI